jgi:hypothetical protein
MTTRAAYPIDRRAVCCGTAASDTGDMPVAASRAVPQSSFVLGTQMWHLAIAIGVMLPALHSVDASPGLQSLPVDFSISVLGGPCSGDGFDTTDGTYRRFLLNGRTATTTFELKSTLREQLFRLVTDVRFSEYPERFAPPTDTIRLPSPRYAITVRNSGQVHTVRWVDVGENAAEALRLRRFIHELYDLLSGLPEVQSLPAPEGGCA